jgi:LacI family transcriptional regulator
MYKKLITQKKIAELVGVSRGTVDRVLNNRGEVNLKTREKVLEIANMMGYTPNLAGKSLVLQQKNLKIGCIIIQSDNPFFSELVQGIENKTKELEGYGIEIILCRVPPSVNKQIQKIDEFLEQNINGLIIQPLVDNCITDKLKMIADKHIFIVTLNSDISGFEHCYVGNDYNLCGKIAANLLDLITTGTCNIGIMTGFFNAQSHFDRINGFQEYIKERPNMRIVLSEENYDDDFESFSKTEKMLKEHPEIDALFLSAGGVYGACRALKKVPDYNRIRVISFDDVPTTKELVKDGTILGTICQQPIRQGELAIEALFNHFLGQAKPITSKLYTDVQIKLKSNIDDLR